MANDATDDAAPGSRLIAHLIELRSRLLRALVGLGIALAAVLALPERVRGRRVGIVLGGGNVDPDTLPTLLGGSMPRIT